MFAMVITLPWQTKSLLQFHLIVYLTHVLSLNRSMSLYVLALTDKWVDRGCVSISRTKQVFVTERGNVHVEGLKATLSE